jgi:hypothetical protein
MMNEQAATMFQVASIWVVNGWLLACFPKTDRMCVFQKVENNHGHLYG